MDKLGCTFTGDSSPSCLIGVQRRVTAPLPPYGPRESAVRADFADGLGRCWPSSAECRVSMRVCNDVIARTHRDCE